MSEQIERQTTAFTSNNGTNGDATSGRRLLSSSGEDKSPIPRTRMTSPSKLSVKVVLILMVVLALAVTIILVATLTAAKKETVPPFNDDAQAAYIKNKRHMGCSENVTVGQAESDWLYFHKSSEHWKSFPAVPDTNYLLVTRKQGLGADSAGVQISIQFPHNNSEIFIMAVKQGSHHTEPMRVEMRSQTCQSLIIDDAKFFNESENHFRIFIYYKNYFPMNQARFAVTSIPLKLKFHDMIYRSQPTTNPEFTTIGLDQRDSCSVEIVQRSTHDCDWWNVEEVDNANFEKMQVHDCIESGVQSTPSATWFFGVVPDSKAEARALLVSPIIERKASLLMLTMWYTFKCEGPELRIHLVPASRSLHKIIDVTSPVQEITEPANHSAWRFVSFQINLPETHDRYHVVLEAIVQRDGNCSGYICYDEDPTTFTKAKSPILGVDDITLELMQAKCKEDDKPNVMDCKFQDGDEGTTCEWKSSTPIFPTSDGDSVFKDLLFGEDNYWNEWKAVNSGEGEDHGATEQHFIGRGHIMSFDALGKATAQSFVRSPKLTANESCTCTMSFFYLLRGIFTPRMQVNLIYYDANGYEQPETQWSLFGHQSEQWERAAIPLTLRGNATFIIEIRVRDITDSRGDVHFDDMAFFGCAMEKYEE